MDASNTGTTTPHLTALHRRQNEVLFAHKNFTFSPCQYVLLAAPSLKKNVFPDLITDTRPGSLVIKKCAYL
jgi:hypothetical protein